MNTLRIVHRTDYRYSEPVKFGPHRILVRPREGHDVHITSSVLRVSPTPEIRWIRDINSNSIANLRFKTPSDHLQIVSKVTVAHYESSDLDFTIDPGAVSFPFGYDMNDLPDVFSYRLATYPNEGITLSDWIGELYRPGHLIGTLDLLWSLNRRIYESFRYQRRDEPGVQRPSETIEKGSGSCRDFAVLFMESVRHWGFAARFVTGYVHSPGGGQQHGSTHAWVEVFIPGAGWRGYDPTNNKLVGSEHVPVGVARHPAKASPVTGTWEGSPGAFLSLDVDVTVNQI